MADYYVLRRDRANTDAGGFYRSMDIAAGPFQSSSDAWTEARDMETSTHEMERRMKERGMFDGIVGNTNYHVLTSQQIAEARQRGIWIT